MRGASATARCGSDGTKARAMTDTSEAARAPALQDFAWRSWPRAIADLRDGLGARALWSSMGWQDIRQRYRRSMLGPFWLTLSMGLMVGGMGVIYAAIFNQPVERYMPHLTLGLLFWNYLTALVNESGTTFVTSEHVIKQIRIPYSVYLLRTIWRNTLILAHNFVVFLVVALVFGVYPNLNTLLFIPGFAIFVMTGFAVGLVFGMISARFRDIPQIVASLLQVVFFITPILWTPDTLTASHRVALINWNPFWHFLEILRAPWLGHAPTPLNWAVAVALCALSWLVMLVFFRRFRSRISFWL
jgi:ABC-2 type transport system permease protein/lipopolysaccharide transport system permease protein